MQNLRNPRWLFIINTLPILVMFTLYISEYSIIKTLLSEESIQLWTNFGLTIGSLGVLNLAYAIYLISTKRKISVVYGIAALLCYIPFIYVYVNYLDDIIPFNIPRWMISDDISIYAGTFLMPTLAYSLFILVSHFTAKSKDYKVWKNFAIAAVVPISWYLFYLVLIPLWRPLGYNFSDHIVVIFTILGTLIFLFFLIRGIYLLATKKSELFKKYELAWKIPICILFPIMGLAANNGFLFGSTLNNSSGIFGNFNNHWFFILAILNGALLCIPDLENKLLRLVLFIGKSITFSFTFYFFIVFLPFLPLSIIAIIFVGVGFLMLAPLALFIVHIKALSQDFAYLKSAFSKTMIRAISILGFLVIPIVLTLSYKADKTVLEEALAYIYTPDYNKEYDIDTESLQGTLDIIKQHKDKNNFFLESGQSPYLSTYFKWLVLDNLTLSDSKIANIEKIFIGEVSLNYNHFNQRAENIRNSDVSITDISSKSTYDESQKTWTSWIDLEITNVSDNSWFSEYATTIKLPEGCYINDYYLYVGDRKEMGILAEKKSAMWVFSQIRNENRDPGILYYLKGNKVAFRVFPFAQNEVRKTGIQIIHREPVQLEIDDCTVQLGNVKEVNQNQGFENENVIYVSAKDKEKLTKVKRKPYFHFMVDASSSGKNSISKQVKQINSLIADYPALSEKALISFTGGEVITQSLNDTWQKNYTSQKFKGGFFLDRALKKSFAENHQKADDSYPVIVVIAKNIEKAILDTDYSDFKIAFPESNNFYHLNITGQLETHSLISNPTKNVNTTASFNLDKTVLKFEYDEGSVAHLPDNDKASIVLKKMIFDVESDDIKKDNWSTALTLHGQWQSQLLHPEKDKKEWLSLVKNSFASNIMTPVTSYLVVENEAQKAILKKKQAQILAGNKSLDADEDTPRMSEPGFYILIFLLLIFIWFRERKRFKIHM